MAAGLDGFLDSFRNADLGEFAPRPFYEPETDSLIFYVRDERSYAKRINKLLTVFLSIADNTLVGCEVKGVQRVLKQLKRLELGGFMVGVHDHTIKLGVFLAFAMVPIPDDYELENQYEDELDQFSNVEVDRRELCPA